MRDFLGLSRFSYAYKFVAAAIVALLGAIIYHWASTIGLLGHGLVNINIQDQFGDVCTFNPGPHDLAGVEDVTIIADHSFYFAHPYRRLFADKAQMAVLAKQLGHDIKVDNGSNIRELKMTELLPLLPEEYRQPIVYVTNLKTTKYPNISFEKVQVEGFDLSKYFEFYPLGVDSYHDNKDNKDYINVIFNNRVGYHVAQFEVVENKNTKHDDTTTKKDEKEQNSKDTTKSTTTTTTDETNTYPIASVKLVLTKVMSNTSWGMPNALTFVNKDSFYITNFLSISAQDNEFASLVELMLLRRNGSVLYCSTDMSTFPPILPAFEMEMSRIKPVNSPEIVSTVSPFAPFSTKESTDSTKATTTTNTNESLQDPTLHCYPLLSKLGQSNGIILDPERKLLIMTGGLAGFIIVMHSETYELLQMIPVPVGVDNIKIDKDNGDLYYSTNSMLEVGKHLADTKHKAPIALYKLVSQSIQFSKSELLKKKLRAQRENDKENGIVTDDEDNIDLDLIDDEKPADDIEIFYYFEPTSIPVVVDTKPIYKGTSPTGLPIPSKYTNGKLTDMPEYKMLLSGAIYDQGIDVCRIIV